MGSRDRCSTWPCNHTRNNAHSLRPQTDLQWKVTDMNDYADLLFARPSFLSGAARTLDLGATYTQYNVLPTPEEADCAALWSDWAAVGEDIRTATVELTPDAEEQSMEVEPDTIAVAGGL